MKTIYNLIMQNLFILFSLVFSFHAVAEDTKEAANRLCTPCLVSSDKLRLDASELSKVRSGSETRQYVFYRIKAEHKRTGERALWCGRGEDLTCEEAMHNCEDKRHLDPACGAETQKAEAK